jgi:ATP-dependent DNA helicase PIF1
MSRATSRTNKILEEEAKKIEKKNAKKNAEGTKNKNASNRKVKDKKTPIVDETFTKNIVFKKVLTP